MTHAPSVDWKYRVGMQNVAQEIWAEQAALASAAHLACYSISCATFYVPTRYIDAYLLELKPQIVLRHYFSSDSIKLRPLGNSN